MDPVHSRETNAVNRPVASLIKICFFQTSHAS